MLEKQLNVIQTSEVFWHQSIQWMKSKAILVQETTTT